MGRKKNNTFYDIVKTILQGLWAILKGLLRLILKILVTFGLWLPGLYAVLGVILYYGLNFDPFDFSVYSIIYLSGAFACVICAAIISVRNIVVNPVRNAFNRKRNAEYEELQDGEFVVESQAEERRQTEEEERFYPLKKPVDPPAHPMFLPDEEEKNEEREEKHSASSLLFDWYPTKEEKKDEPTVRSVPKKEIPEVYFSRLNPNILVHEYSDRFELYKVKGDVTEYVGVEYKQ